MDLWQEINDILKEACLGKESEANSKLHSLLKQTKDSKDPILIKSILTLNKQLKGVTNKTKSQWLTGTINGSFYPPIDVLDATIIPWNSFESNQLMLNDNDKLSVKYPRIKSLNNEAGYDKHLKLSGDKRLYIEQNVDIDDCSFVASLINIRQAKLELPCIRKISPNIYYTNFCFNGSNRRLAMVDCSCIPTTIKNEQLSLRSHSISDKIIEIGYLKLTANSFSTEGSNVAIATYILTGFLPEVSTVEKFTFETLVKYFNSGLCMMALGTNSHSREDELQYNILENHDYSIIDVVEENRQIILQDPLDHKLDIRIDFDDRLKKTFYQLYINWNSSKLFKSEKSVTFHYNCDLSNLIDSLYEKPVFQIKNNSSKTETVWAFLETHISDRNKENNTRKYNIAYIQEVPKDNVFTNPFPPRDSAVNIGLQLSKMEIPPNKSKYFFVHSTKSTYFTLHVYSISSLIELLKIKSDKLIEKHSYCWPLLNSDGSNYLLNGKDFYLNPTFEFEYSFHNNEEILLSLQLHSSSYHDLLNLQLYNFLDDELLHPILLNSRYEKAIFSKVDIPIMTNTRYKLISSRSKNDGTESNYSILMHAARKDYDYTLFQKNDLHLNFQRIYTEYGGLAYQKKSNIVFRQTENRYKLKLYNSDKTNEIFIRIKPFERNMKSIRCNVFDGESYENLYYNEHFTKCGLIISHLKIRNDCKIFVLLIELEEVSMSDLNYEIYIGSKWKLSLNEND